MPLEASPGDLFQLTMEAAHTLPMWCAVAGFAGSAHPVERSSSFDAFWRWSKRYWGLDVHDADRARHHVGVGLPSLNWCTAVGPDLFARAELDPSALRNEAEAHGLGWIVAPHAVVVRAGEQPTLGDGNSVAPAMAYRRAAAVLAPLALAQPVRMIGPFWRGDESVRWARRFSDPAGWSG